MYEIYALNKIFTLLVCENHKILMKEMKKDLSKWSDIMWSWMGSN